jgi:hypothetical protein
MLQVPLRGVRQSGAVSGSVHSSGRIFSAVFRKISVPPFRRDTKWARFVFHWLKQARKSASLCLFGQRNSGPYGVWEGPEKGEGL